MPATVDTGSRVSGVTWYEVHTMRKADSKGTLVSFVSWVNETTDASAVHVSQKGSFTSILFACVGGWRRHVCRVREAPWQIMTTESRTSS